jgi:internalin A
MTKLKVLKMGKNDIEDVSPLANLKSLQVLELFENMIEDITPLKSLGNLEYLSVFGNYLGALVKHSKMSKRKKMTQEKENLKTFNALTELKFLGASVNCFTTIEHYTEARNLRYLNMSNNRISDISNLKKMSNLKYLVLKKNYLTSIDSVKNLKQLVSLKLSGDNNQIKCWAPLAPLSRITKSAYFSINHKIGGVANRKIDGLSKGDEYTCIQCARRGRIQSPLIKKHCRGLGKYSEYFCEQRPFDFCIQRNCNKACNKVPLNKKGVCRKKCRSNSKGDVFKICKKDFKQECK